MLNRDREQRGVRGYSWIILHCWNLLECLGSTAARQEPECSDVDVEGRHGHQGVGANWLLTSRPRTTNHTVKLIGKMKESSLSINMHTRLASYQNCIEMSCSVYLRWWPRGACGKVGHQSIPEAPLAMASVEVTESCSSPVLFVNVAEVKASLVPVFGTGA